jgi:hypothetical protein
VLVVEPAAEPALRLAARPEGWDAAGGAPVAVAPKVLRISAWQTALRHVWADRFPAAAPRSSVRRHPQAQRLH